jgi:hypothetical protein
MEVTMNGLIIDINNTGAFVELMDGTIKEIPINHLPTNSKLGDTVEVTSFKSLNMMNDMMKNIF